MAYRIYTRDDSNEGTRTHGRGALVWLGIGGIIGCAVLLRMWRCFSFPFFGDEVFSLHRSQDFQEFWRTWEIAKVGNIQFSIAFALNSLILDSFEDPVVAIRVIPLAAGIAFFPIFFWLFRGRLSAATTLLSLTMLAFNPTHVYFSQYGRYYAVEFLLTNVAMYTFFISIEDRSWRLFLASQFFSVLAFLTHPSAGLLVASEIAYLAVLGMYSWTRGDRILPPVDTFSKVVGGTLVVGCLLLLVAAGWTLFLWRDISTLQSNYGLTRYASGTALRFGLSLMAFSVPASLYSFYRRDRIGTFYSLALFCPYLEGVVLSSLGMEVNPIYVSFAIFPGCVLVAHFLAELVQVRNNATDPKQTYGVALISAVLAALAVAYLPELGSYYVDGNRTDVPAALNWIEEARHDKGAIVITQGVGGPVHFCQTKGIDYAALPHEATIDTVVQAVDSGKVVHMSYAWWLKAYEQDASALHAVPHWIILGAERDGMTPKAPATVRYYEEWSDSKNEFTSQRDPSDTLKSNYRLETRIGKPRLDHRSNYLLVYSPIKVN